MRIAIYGTRRDGHAKVCLSLALRLGFECVGVLDDINPGAEAFGLPSLGEAENLGELSEHGVEGIVLGFGCGRGRAALVKSVYEAGLKLPTLIDPDAEVDATAAIADGAVVLRGALVGEDVEIGEAALVNMGAILTHDSGLGPGASIGPGTILAGRARVGAGVELGAGAVLLPDIRIGDNAIVAAGAVVVEPVEAGTIVAGVPARRMDERRSYTSSPD